MIAVKENLHIPEKIEAKFYNMLFFISGGDLRKAINTLQMAVALDLIENLNLDEIMQIAGFLDEPTMTNLIKLVNKRDFESIRGLVENMEKIDSRNLIRQINGNLKNFKLQEERYSQLISYFGEIDYKISQGADEKLQIIALLGKIIEHLN